MDCYPDFSERMAFHLQVPYRAPLPPRLHAIARKFVSLYGRAPDEFRFWIPGAEAAIAGQIPDLANRRPTMVSFGEPMSDHLLALRIRRRTGIPWVAHFSDPWADNPFRRFFAVANIWNRRMEREVITAADRVVFTSAETLSLVMAKYPDEWSQKAAVLPHSYDPDFYPAPSARADKLVVRYLGNFYADRTPFPLLDALAVVQNGSPNLLADVRFELIGGMPERMRERARRMSLPSGLVEFIPSVSYRKSLGLMAEADLVMVIDAPAEASVFLPSKLVDYVGAAVPILGIVPPGSSSELIGRLGGKVANPTDSDGIAKVLLEALRECRERRKDSVQPWGRAEVRGEYEIRRVIPQFMKLVDFGTTL